MNRNPAIALLALSTLGACARVVAQEPALQANVPFEFTVGSKQLPADTYTITSSSPGVIMVQSNDRRYVSITTAYHGDPQSTKSSKLVFDKVGDRYFLHKIVCPASGRLNMNIPASKQEKQIQLQEAKLGESGQVLVAAR